MRLPDIQPSHPKGTALLLSAALFWISLATGDELEPVAGHPDAVEFSLVDLEGNGQRLSQYLGAVVLVSFWATWCPECVWEMPFLKTVSETFVNDRFVVLAINVGEEAQPVRAFVDRYKLTFPVLLDPDLETYKKWPVLGVPASFLIDRQGKIVYSVVGAVEWNRPDTLKQIKELLALPQGEQDLRKSGSSLPPYSYLQAE